VHHANIAVTGGKLYLFGGGSRASDLVQVYDPATDRWSAGAPLPTSRTAVATALLAGRVHVLGGTDGINQGRAMPTHEVYDPVADSWATRAPLPVASEHVYAGTIGGRIFVVGGRDALSPLAHTQIYDPATDSWTMGAPLPVPTSGMAVAVFRDRLYVFGGEDIPRGAVLGAVQRYDPASDRWELLAPLPVAVHGVASAVYQDAIFLFGGSRAAASGVGESTVQRLAFAPLAPPPGGKPAKPTQLTGSLVGQGAALLRWRDNARNETSYVVEVKAPGAKAFVVGATLEAGATTVTVTGLVKPGVYRFRVVALAGPRRSPPSNVVALRVPRR
jgi:N-acetylneuraminic acid mutarotase